MGKEVASCAQDNVTLGGEVKLPAGYSQHADPFNISNEVTSPSLGYTDMHATDHE